MLRNLVVGMARKYRGGAWRGVIGVVASSLLLFTANAAVAAFPDRPIRLVVPWPAGATTDAIARVFAEQLGQRLGGSVVVENRGGANAIIGTQSVARSAPDGYTLLFTTSEPISINPHIYSSLPYDVEKDLDPIAFVGRTYFVIAARSDFPANDIPATIALAKKDPAKINVGSYGIANLFLGSFESVTGTEFTRIPYQGAGPAISAVIAGQVDLTLAASFSAAQHIRGGRVKLLAVGSSKRLGFIPDVPTFVEQGMPGFEIGNWLSIFAPHGTPQAVREALSAATRAVVQSKQFVERAQAMGIDAEFRGPGELLSFLQSDSARWAKVAKDKNIKAD